MQTKTRIIAAAELERRRRSLERRRSLSFREFVEKNYPRYEWYRHCEKLADVLQRVADGELRRVMIFMPPRGGKSLLASKLFPAYYLYRNPDRWFGVASYAAELAYSFSRAARDAYKNSGGSLRRDSKNVKQWETLLGGGLWAAGVGGPATGRGFSCGLIDDPIKNAEEASSNTIREKHKNWYSSVFYTRAEPDAAIIVIQTRWHEDDLSGWLLQQEKMGDRPERWHIVNFEAIKQEGDYDFPKTCTIEPDWRSPGEALNPERFDLYKLGQIAEKIGAYYFNALYQQRPTPIGGGIIKPHWIERYQNPPQSDRIILSWDTAHKAQNQSDYSVCTIWSETKTGYYLIDLVRDRLEYPDLKRTAINLAVRWRPSAILIEDRASGQSLIQDLRREGNWNVIPIRPAIEKTIRLAVEAPAFEAGRVFFPEFADWLPELEQELFKFPNTAHDDQVDSISQFLNWARNNFSHNWGQSYSNWGYSNESAIASLGIFQEKDTAW